MSMYRERQPKGNHMGDTQKALGSVIRARRRELGLTQAQVADIVSETASADPPSISRIERGQQGYTPEVLEGIARALRTTPSELLQAAEAQTHGPRATPALPVNDEQEALTNLRIMPPSVRRAAYQLLAEMARAISR